MRKIILIAFVSILSLGTFTSCSDDDDNTVTPVETVSTNNVFVLPIRKVKPGQSIADFKTKRDAYVALLEQQFGTLTDKEMQPFFDYVTYQPQSTLDSIFIGFTSFQDVETFNKIGTATSNSTQASEFFSTFNFIDFLTLKPNNSNETVDLSTLAPLGSGRVWEVAVRDLSQYSNFNSTDYKSKRDAYLAVLAAQPGFVREIQWTDINNPNKVVGMTIYASQQAVIDINSNPAFIAAANATGFIQNYPPNVFGTINTVLK